MLTKTRNYLFYSLFAALLAAQGAFWYQTHHIKPDMSIVPDVPGKDTVHALSFGDKEAFFRLLGLRIQNSGDTFGRFTALYKYDFNKLYHWFRLLDSLNDTSNYIPSMANYYFAQSQNKADIQYIVDYLVEHAVHRPEEKWWWVAQASYLANHKLNNSTLALEIANHLIGVKNAPMWAQQLPAFIHEQQGEMQEALNIIQGIMDDIENNPDSLSQGELNFMRYFVEERLQRMDTMQKQFDDVQNKKNDISQEDEQLEEGEDADAAAQ